MKAVVVDPEALSPSPSEAVVRVRAVSLYRGEVRRAETPKAGYGTGWYLAGTVERAAEDGSGSQEGARVVGFSPDGTPGSHRRLSFSL